MLVLLVLALAGIGSGGCRGGDGADAARPAESGEPGDAQGRASVGAADAQGDLSPSAVGPVPPLLSAGSAPAAVISLTEDGDRYLDDGAAHRGEAPVSRRELVAVLARIAAEDPQALIHLDVDPRVRHYHLMNVVDTLHLYGLDNIRYAVKGAAEVEESADRGGQRAQEAVAPPRVERPIIITLAADGEVLLDEDGRQVPIHVEDLGRMLEAVASEQPDTLVRIEADRRVRYYRLMKVADTIKASGLTDISLRTTHGGREDED